MAMERLLFAIYVIVIVLQSHVFSGQASTLTITNECDYTVWPVVQERLQQNANSTGFALQKDESRIVNVVSGWTGTVWGRTLCAVNSSSGNFTCQTGDCGSGNVNCSGGRGVGTAPVTLAEFALQTVMKEDFYDVSLVDGFNVPLTVTPQGGSGPNCSVAGCPVDLNTDCPAQLRVQNENRSMTVACKSACLAFGSDTDNQYCCTNGSSPQGCPISSYTLYFARNCPRAYSYSFDDAYGTNICNGSTGYTIRFCPSQSPGKKNNALKIVAIVVSIVVALLVLFVAVCVYSAKKRARRNDLSIFERADGDDYTFESLQCGLGVLQAATNNFSDDNKIGKGGFGVVYKGTLPSGKQIAVKKLLTKGKAEEEFKNEMKVVAKLQHRNLVKLLAFCYEGDERILIFEYVPNKSLDYFIFDAEEQDQLDWSSRFKIIVGIARGLLYLHEDSRLRIIHRDLKPSNILLDTEMNPKIADFGMARIFGTSQIPDHINKSHGNILQVSGVDQTHQSTSKAGGTWGYIAPEYAQTRRFSVKTDVYSYGVLILEIISGKRNSTFRRLGLTADLLSYAWMLWKDGTPMELMDTTLKASYSENEVMRCIYLGLLCVQRDPDTRPTMATVVHIMLNDSSTNALPVPQPPPFLVSTESGSQSHSLSDQLENMSINKASITELEPR